MSENKNETIRLPLLALRGLTVFSGMLLTFDVERAASIVRAENKATAALLQRQLNIGYARAARLLDVLEDLGIIGPYQSGEPREVLPADEPVDPEDEA